MTRLFMVLVALASACWGCASLARRTELAAPTSQPVLQDGLVNAVVDATVQAAVDAVLAAQSVRTGDVGGSVTGKATQIGGAGDSVTSWLAILVLGVLVAGCLGGLMYAFVLRPLGIRSASPPERAAKYVRGVIRGPPLSRKPSGTS